MQADNGQLLFYVVTISLCLSVILMLKALHRQQIVNRDVHHKYATVTVMCL